MLMYEKLAFDLNIYKKKFRKRVSQYYPLLLYRNNIIRSITCCSKNASRCRSKLVLSPA